MGLVAVSLRRGHDGDTGRQRGWKVRHEHARQRGLDYHAPASWTAAIAWPITIARFAIRCRRDGR